MSIKGALDDPHGVLSNWDEYSVDPCSWTMITCSSDNLVIGLLVLLSSQSHFHITSFYSFPFFLNAMCLQGSAEPISFWNFISSNSKFNKSSTSVRTLPSLHSHLSFSFFPYLPLTSAFNTLSSSF